MKDNIIKFDKRYAKTQEVTLNEKTNEILNKVKKTFGLEKNYEELKNYATYIQMKKNKTIDFGSYNILITNESEYKSTTDIVEVIKDILVANDIIKTSYVYLGKENLRSRVNTVLDEDLIIIDSKVIDMDLAKNSNNIISYMNKNKEKIFILIDNDTDGFKVQGLINARFWDYFTWEMTLKPISKEEKEKYIKKLLKNNQIKVDEEFDFVTNLSEEPFWIVLKTIKDIILDCKMRGITYLTEENIKEDYRRKYVRKKKEISKSSAMEELNSLIGMDKVKEQIESIVNYIKVNKNRKQMPALHMVFTGNPGTGKTTVARIIGKLFKEMKILSDKNIFVEAQRNDLIGEFVGQTAPKTMKVINRASGGVLFIDEAYTLSTYIKDEAGGDYGAECIGTLIKEMEDKRDKMCVILAGYEKEMEHLLKCNPGFSSRIQFKIDFPDCSEEELYEIFKKMVKKENYKLTNNVKEPLFNYFKEEKKKENFSNARCVRNLFEKIKFEQASRIVKEKNANINTIKKCDIENVINKISEKKVEKIKIGFAV